MNGATGCLWEEIKKIGSKQTPFKLEKSPFLMSLTINPFNFPIL
jgi:hypothetical protein